MTPAVACSSIKGFGDYVPLEEAVLTRDDKLQLYYEPSGYLYETVGKEYRVHFTQDARLHRRGQKAVLQSKEKILELQGQEQGAAREHLPLEHDRPQGPAARRV